MMELPYGVKFPNSKYNGGAHMIFSMEHDLISDDADARREAREAVLQAMKKYTETEDYRLLLQYDPALANTLSNPDLKIEFSAAPSVVMGTVSAEARGELWHIGVDFVSRTYGAIVDCRSVIRFETELRPFLCNPEVASHETLSKAFEIFDCDIPSWHIVDFTDRKIQSFAEWEGRKALLRDAREDGYKSTDVAHLRCNDIQFHPSIKQVYWPINPVYTTVFRNKKEEKLLFGYIYFDGGVQFKTEPLGAEEQKKARNRAKKKHIAIGIVSGVVALGIAIALLVLFL